MFVRASAESNMPLTSAPKVVEWTVNCMDYWKLEFTYVLITPDKGGIAYACLELNMV
jgi:hypothetical protein